MPQIKRFGAFFCLLADYFLLSCLLLLPASFLAGLVASEPELDARALQPLELEADSLYLRVLFAPSPLRTFFTASLTPLTRLLRGALSVGPAGRVDGAFRRVWA